MDQVNVDLEVFQETKVTDGVHTRKLSGYHVLAADALRRHQGGVSVFYQTPDLSQVEAHQVHVTNVASFHLELGGQRRFVVGCYLSPDDASMIDHVVVSTSQIPHWFALIVAGYFNADLAKPEGHPCDK